MKRAIGRSRRRSGPRGRGLGLAGQCRGASRNLERRLRRLFDGQVAGHLGWVELESAPDSGTRVTCHLPIEQPVEPAVEVAVGAAASAGVPEAPAAEA